MSNVHNAPQRSKILQRRETLAAYAFLLPSLIFFIGFVIIPMFICIYTSFFDSTMGKEADVFIGFANYTNLLKDPIFLKALSNTILVVVVSVPVVWKWMYNNYYGIFNYVGKGMGLIDKNINWLGDEKYALWCIILILLTTSVGQPIVLYISAFGNVDNSLVEAAQVDGATDTQLFWKIKWPQVMPTTLYILVITTINSFQIFALIQLLTSGGPNHSTDTVMYYIYYSAFKLYKYGYANAMGVVLAVFIALLSAVQFRMAREK